MGVSGSGNGGVVCGVVGTIVWYGMAGVECESLAVCHVPTQCAVLCAVLVGIESESGGWAYFPSGVSCTIEVIIVAVRAAVRWIICTVQYRTMS